MNDVGPHVLNPLFDLFIQYKTAVTGSSLIVCKQQTFKEVDNPHTSLLWLGAIFPVYSVISGLSSVTRTLFLERDVAAQNMSCFNAVNTVNEILFINPNPSVCLGMTKRGWEDNIVLWVEPFRFTQNCEDIRRSSWSRSETILYPSSFSSCWNILVPETSSWSLQMFTAGLLEDGRVLKLHKTNTDNSLYKRLILFHNEKT